MGDEMGDVGSKALCARSREIEPDSRSLSPHQDERFRLAPLQESDADKNIAVASGDSLHKLFLHPPLRSSSGSRALYTTPMAPRPSSSRIT